MIEQNAEIAKTLNEYGLDAADYWTVEVSGVEWVYTMSKIISPLEPLSAEGKNPVVMIVGDDGSVLYMLKKQFTTAARLGQMFGITEDEVSKSAKIILSEVNPKLPKPTVSPNVWGTA